MQEILNGPIMLWISPCGTKAMASQIYAKIQVGDLPREMSSHRNDLWILRTAYLPKVDVSLGSRPVPMPTWPEALGRLGDDGTYTACRSAFHKNRIYVPVGKITDTGWRFSSSSRPSISMILEKLDLRQWVPKMVGEECPYFEIYQILGMDKSTVRWLCRSQGSRM
jgi:hypothetical protein